MKKLFMTVLVLAVFVSGCSLFVDGAIKRDISANYAVVKSFNEAYREGAATPNDAIPLLEKIERSLETWTDYCYGKSPDKEVAK